MVSGALLNKFRPFDSLGRWEIGKFIALIVNVNQDHLFLLADRFYNIINKLSLPLGKGNIKVTVSIGTTLAKSEDTLETLISRVKQLKNMSIKRGGNQISKA